MSSAAVIINVRHQLPWYRRMLSDGATASLWAAWLWMCKPALGLLGFLIGSANASVSKLALIGGATTLEAPVFALVGTSSTLMLWNLIPADITPQSVPRTLQDDARDFDLPVDQLAAARAAAVCVVHHGADGRILRIETASSLATSA